MTDIYEIARAHREQLMESLAKLQSELATTNAFLKGTPNGQPELAPAAPSPANPPAPKEEQAKPPAQKSGKGVARKPATRAPRLWLKEEDDLLRKGKAEGWSYRWMGRQLNRTEGAVAQRCGVLGLRGRKAPEWTHDERQVLDAAVECGTPLAEIFDALPGRTCTAIESRMRSWGLYDAWLKNCNTK